MNKRIGRLLATSLFAAAAAVMPAAPSVARTDAPSPKSAARPNVVLIVLDDVGFSDIGAFGSEIATPNIDALAQAGLRYTRFDSKAICSATRAALLTGRNNQTVRMEDLASDLKRPDPADTSASKGELPRNAETLAAAFHRAGYATHAIGKWHLAPAYDDQPGQDRGSWPRQRGFDTFYGFIGGWTDQYRPKLVEDNRELAVPADPSYHLSSDLADHAIAAMKPGAAQPRFLYLAFGAGHSPLQVPKPYVDRYTGTYDDGWDALREKRFACQKRLGIMPASASLPPREAGDAAWSSLTQQQRRVFSRFMAVYAGFLTHADEQVGRLVAYLKATGQYDNTLFVVLSDNGAASEGGPKGTMFNHYADTTTVAQMDARLDELGGPTTVPLYQRPWAYAGVTPFRRYKLWPYAGGVRTPLIVSWQRGIRAHGAIRQQYVDAIDLAPTLLDVAGTRFRSRIDGVSQMPVAGRSIRATFTSGAARTRDTQFFELRGNRAITHGNWRAVALHKLGTDFAADRWQLFDTQADPAEAVDVAARHPERLKAMEALWWREARRYSNPPITPPKPGMYMFNHMGDAFGSE